MDKRNCPKCGHMMALHSIYRELCLVNKCTCTVVGGYVVNPLPVTRKNCLHCGEPFVGAGSYCTPGCELAA